MATRTGKVILAKGIRLDKNYKNVLNYSESDMVNLVTNHKVVEASNCSFTRVGENDIKIQVPYGDAIKCNYIAFQNPDYSNKWFFGFIDEVIYVANDTTRIKFTIDEYSTWKDYWEYCRSFVIREHVNSDIPGEHTVPEGLETGDYEIVDLRYASMYESQSPSADFWVVFCVTELPTDHVSNIENGRVKGDLGYIGGVFSSMIFFATAMQGAKYIIQAYENDPDTSTDAIKNLYMVPRCCVNENITLPTHYHPEGGAVDIQMYPLYNYYQSDEFSLQQPDVLAENYFPKNQKLKSYPYSYFFATNNVGESIDFRYEDFPMETIDPDTTARRTIRYTKYLVPSASVSGKLIFNNYKTYESSSDYQTKLISYGINYGKIPVCAWTTDYYTNWLTQNGVNIALDFLKAGTITALGLATGGIGAAAGIAAGVNTVFGAVQRDEQQAMVPPQSHGDINTGDFAFAFSRNIISFYEMSIRPEFAKIIDDYFSARGYKVNQVKIPNETGRPYWNYVQIGEGEIVGYSKNTASVPAGSMDVINTIYRNGVTIWHNHDNIGNYSLDNSL